MMVYKQLSFIDKLPPKDKPIIDLGCGDGRLAEPFYEEGYPVIGIEKDPERIAEAKKVMPKADLRCEDIRTALIPEGFIILRSVLPFFDSKEEVRMFIKKNLKNSMYFTLFGLQDEKAGKALTWTREEVDAMIKEIGNVIRFSETIGLGVNLINKPRMSHIFEIIRIV